MHFRLVSRLAIFAGLGLLVARGPAAAQSTAPDPSAGNEDQGYVEYQLRANEDPSRVARMFHVTIEDLLRLNNISDPRRLSVGQTLKIPDPRATTVQQLRTDKASLQQQLASAQSGTASLQERISALETQVGDLKDANEVLQTDQMLYRTMRAALVIAAAIAVLLAFALLVAWGKARQSERQHVLALNQIAVLKAAVDKYRQLSAQFELKYQGLFHHVGIPSPLQTRAQTLRAAYDEDRARMDAIVAEAEQEIRRAMVKVSPKKEPVHGEARLAAMAAARKA